MSCFFNPTKVLGFLVAMGVCLSGCGLVPTGPAVEVAKGSSPIAGGWGLEIQRRPIDSDAGSGPVEPINYSLRLSDRLGLTWVANFQVIRYTDEDPVVHFHLAVPSENVARETNKELETLVEKESPKAATHFASLYWANLTDELLSIPEAAELATEIVLWFANAQIPPERNLFIPADTVDLQGAFQDMFGLPMQAKPVERQDNNTDFVIAHEKVIGLTDQMSRYLVRIFRATTSHGASLVEQRSTSSDFTTTFGTTTFDYSGDDAFNKSLYVLVDEDRTQETLGLLVSGWKHACSNTFKNQHTACRKSDEPDKTLCEPMAQGMLAMCLSQHGLKGAIDPATHAENVASRYSMRFVENWHKPGVAIDTENWATTYQDRWAHAAYDDNDRQYIQGFYRNMMTCLNARKVNNEQLRRHYCYWAAFDELVDTLAN